MNTMEIMQLETRIRTLERRSRLGWTAAACLGLFTLVAMAVAPPDELRARRLVIEDAEGRPRIVIAAPITELLGRKRSDPATGMLLLDEHGVDRVVLGAPTTDPQVGGVVQSRIGPGYGININDRTGEERGGYGVIDGMDNDGGDDRVVLGLDHETGEGVMLFVTNEYSGVLVNSAADGQQRQRVFLGVGGPKQATTFLNLDDGKGIRRVALSATAEAGPTVQVYDSAAQRIFSIPEQPDPKEQQPQPDE